MIEPTSAQRSALMSRIRAVDTKPEMRIRKALHALGYRYRLHDKRLPGRPDIVFPSRHAVIFVNGCFWHGHSCNLFHWPKSNSEFWKEKINKNVRRDRVVKEDLTTAGWRVLYIWECAIRGRHALGVELVAKLCSEWLESDSVFREIGEPN